MTVVVGHKIVSVETPDGDDLSLEHDPTKGPMGKRVLCQG
jgi:hypothetical protein